MCYNVRYMFENGNGKGSSWSLRQMSLYQKQNLNTGRTTWIFIRPSKTVRDWLQARRHDEEEDGIHSSNVHIVLLRQCADSWKSYISHLRSALEQLDSKASFAKLGKKTFPDDYDVSLKDSQRLQKIQRKVFRAQAVIEGTAQTILRFQKLDKRRFFAQVKNPRYTSTLHEELEDIIATLESHRRILTGLITYSHGTANLLQQITSHRAMTDLQSTTETLNTSLYLLRGIASISQSQSESMLTLAQSGKKDSLRMKTLTHVATLYLPPTLIAVSDKSISIRFYIMSRADKRLTRPSSAPT